MTTQGFEGYPVSPQQERVWRLGEAGDRSVLRSACILRIEGELDAAGLRQAWDEVVARHEILRTDLRMLPGMHRPVQTVNGERTSWLDGGDLSGLDAAAQERRLEALLDEMARPRGSAGGWPATCSCLVRLGPSRHALLLSASAYVSDAPGLGCLARHLLRTHDALARGVEQSVGRSGERDAAEGGEAPLQYAVIAEWLNDMLESEDAEAARARWGRIGLSSLRDRRLPLERRTPAREFVPRRAEVALDHRLAESLDGVARGLGSDLETLLLAAWLVLLFRVTGDGEPVVGAGFDPRAEEELADALGPLMRFVPVTCRLSQTLRFDRLVQELAAERDEAYEWQECFAWPESADRGADGELFFPVAFELQRLPERLDASERSVTLGRLSGCVDRFKIKLVVLDRGPGSEPELSLHYDEGTVTRYEVARFGERLTTLLAGIARSPEAELRELPAVGPSERAHLVFERNRTEAGYSLERTLHESIAERAAEHPERVAVSCGEVAVTYGEIQRRIARLTAELLRVGVGAESLVGVMLDRSVDMVVSLLAVLRAGGAYLPLDPSYPEERLRSMVRAASPRAVIADNEVSDDAGFEGIPVLSPHSQKPFVEATGPEAAAGAVPPENLAYVIYTSGSTGEPKGVMMSHRSILNRLLWMLDRFPFTAGDRVLQKTPISFDASIWELFVPLLAGAQVVLARPGGHQDSAYLVRAIADQRVTVFQSVPSLLRVLLEEPGLSECRSLRRVFCGGEALAGDLPRRLMELVDVEVTNLYGPTETAIDASFRVCAAGEDRDVVPIGAPLSNVRIYVLGGDGRLVPEGTPGELCVAGAGLARGYLGRPGLTAERFVPSPCGGVPGARLYTTGDLVQINAAGELEFLGRLDDQVKVRGFRIELGEVESVLCRHEAVREAVAVVRDDVAGGDLAAFVVLASGGGRETAEQVRGWLADRLPEHMVPFHVLPVELLPRTPSGKIDRHALPDLDALLDESRELVAPRTPAEELIAGLWTTLLGREPIGVYDDFFELGGHSLLATQLVTRLRQMFSVELSLRAVFDRSTVEALGQLVEQELRAGHRVEAPPLVPVDRDQRLPLSFPQQRLWFLEQLEPGNPAYHISTAVRISGPLSVVALERSLRTVVDRHEGLRTRFVTVDGEPEQRIAPRTPFRLSSVDLRPLDDASREQELVRLAAREARAPFDLVDGPMFRVKLVELADEERALLLAFHHLVSDGWSMGIFVRELTAAYRALLDGETPSLPELPVQYADYSWWQRSWLRGEALERQLGYWRDRLGSGGASLQLPTDRPRPPVQTYEGASRSRRLPDELGRRLRKLGRGDGATLFMVISAGLQLLLSRHSQQSAVSLGTPVAGRHWPEVEHLIGLFVNTLVLRTEISGDLPFAALLGRVREVALGAYAHQDVPFEMIVEALQPERDLAQSPLFQVMLTFEAEPPAPIRISGLELGGVDLEVGTVQFDLELTVGERGDGLVFDLGYNSGLFDGSTAERLLDHLANLLEAACDMPTTPVAELPMLAPAERHQLLWEWNDGPRPVVERSFVERLAATVSSVPDRVAAVFGGSSVSYGELARRAWRAASVLSSQGVSPGDLVVLLAERGLGLLVSILGTFEAGAAYLPLDPQHPPGKLAQVLAASRARFVVVGPEHGARLEESLASSDFERPRVLGIEELIDGRTSAGEESGAPEARPGLGELAYVIFTSGSTGVPKGVMVEHLGMVNHLEAKIHDLALGADDVVAQTASQTFDISVWQHLAALVVGGRVVILPPPVAMDPVRLAAESARHRVTVLEVVPSLLRVLVEIPAEGPAGSASGDWGLRGLRWMIPTGEALPPSLCREWLAGSPEVPLLNAYGPTECSDDVSHQVVAEAPGAEAASVPIGRAVANTHLVVVDRRLLPVPLGVGGELLVGGLGVGRGYLGSPRRTAESFVPDPFSEVAGARAYRTGDLARVLTDGTVDFLGRLDHQVKIRGFRIELGEVEVALSSVAGVREVVAVARELGADKQLVAYYAAEPDAGVAVEELRAAAAARLPEYMVPAVFVELDRLPLTANGKIDRRALPEPEATAAAREHAVVEPRNPVERRLQRIWEELLDARPIGVEDDFFRLGGHSLLAVRLVAAVKKQMGEELPLALLFQAPTIAELAARIGSGGLASSPLVEIQPGDEGRPRLILVHPVGGTVLAYQELAGHLGDDQPVSALQDPYLQLARGGEVRLSLEEMAAEYVSALLAAQPDGPYLLGGWSFGGLVAYEMARQMTEADREVALLAILDARPGGAEPPEESDLEMLLGIARDLERRAGAALALRDEDLANVAEPRRTDHVLVELKSAGLIAPELAPEMVGRYVQRRRFNELAAWEYRPRPYTGTITYFRATDADPLTDGGDRPRQTDSDDDPSDGWAQLASRPVEVHEVPGYHAGLIFDPYVQVLAERLRSSIDRAQEV